MKNLTLILLLMLVHIGTNAQYDIGSQATDFSLQSVDGKKVSLSDYADAKGYIVIFTCNTCPFAVAYEDRINDLDSKYKGLGFPVIAINPNDPELSPKDNMEAMIQRSADKNFSFPYLLDLGQKIYPQYGARRTPHVFVLHKEEGNNIVRYIGAIDNNHEDANDASERYVENAVDALLKGEAVKTEKTVAIGCDIKVKK
ncbi:thioredoxin family protein [Sphingobacterium phlebotomi]|uniref:Thioredoxin family protein n=1 Tax=Sphingobacterium phlebotomi TaxID=2605433 RepID=A0A5D4GYI8_9SPHI|nr:thioredoxin family protein [Sphingobacterium phlebotomi]TYR33357.1 thioredoxin family protein [Sphingobacterium phlebotomi]